MSAPSILTELIERLSTARVLMVGDVMLDRYVSGEVERISPEAPIPVLRVARETAMLGGAGNVAANVAALGGVGAFVALLGDDDAGAEIRHLVKLLVGIEPFFSVDAGRRTTLKTRFVGGNQQLVRADVETLEPIDGEILDALCTHVRSAVRDQGAVILSDYGKGVLHTKLLRVIIEEAQANAVPVVIDPKGREYARYKGADLITPNKRELADATGMPVDSDADVIAACEHLIASCELRGVLATRSAQGMTLVRAGHEPVHFKTQAREVYDVSGAGDTVAATLALALAAGADAKDAARLANIAAGVVVGKSGTATVSAHELSQTLHHMDLDRAEAKSAGLDQAVVRVRSWRKRGLKVGFTNGCFDLLHPGHIALLEQARQSCDRLVVGLNSDASIKRLKGEARPVQGEAARAAVLGALSAVDLVVLFSEDTPLCLIEALQPDVLVKGADYSVETVVGADMVQAYGGVVLLAELIPGHSTTETIRRLADNGAIKDRKVT